MIEALFSVNHLSKRYRQLSVVHDLSLFLKEGEVVGLLGANGAGKTTTFNLIMGLELPDEGSIVLEGKDITSLPSDQRARRGLGYLAQEPAIFSDLTLEENIRIVLDFLPITKAEKQNRIKTILEELDLYRLKDRRAGLLSGGERRRTEIARALILQPKVLLMDEPFANIDPRSIEEVRREVRSLAERGIAILITDHNARELLALADRSYLLHQGSILTEGSKEALIEDPLARTYYLGNLFADEGLSNSLAKSTQKSSFLRI